jgi:prepilin-type N-terminal cleavage/methylation domain-containing protein
MSAVASFHSGPRARGGFTLIEVMLASVMAAMILLAVYAVFSRAIRLRDSATERMRTYQLRARASRTIRQDVQNAWISGGVLASVLDGSPSGSDGLEAAVPGYLKFTTTTGKDTADDLYGDVQQVEYYIAKDGTSSGAKQSGKLVRILTRDLLDTNNQQNETQQLVLAGVQSFTVSFYDGTTWQDSWQYTSSAAANAANSSSSSSSSTTSTSSSSGTTASAGIGNTTVPVAIRIDIQQVAPSAKESVPPPLEITVPWTAQPYTALPTPSYVRAAAKSFSALSGHSPRRQRFGADRGARGLPRAGQPGVAIRPRDDHGISRVGR